MALGGRVGPAPEPVHGKTSAVEHDGIGIIDDVEAEWPEDGVQQPVDPGRGFSFDIPAGKVGVVRLAPAKRLKRLLKKTARKPSPA